MTETDPGRLEESDGVDRLHPTDRELARSVETGTGGLGLDLTRRLAAEAFGTAS